MSIVGDMTRRLQREIERGVYPPGAQLPTESVLMDSYQVSRNTVRTALTRLISAGLVTAQQGQGYFVQVRRPLTWMASDPERGTDTASPSDAWSRGVRAQGREPRVDIEVLTVRPPARVAALLDLYDGEYAILRRRDRYVDRRCYMLADSYFPEKLVRDTPIALPGDVVPGTYAVLRPLGLDWDASKDVLSFRAPTLDEEDRFGGLPDGVFVVEHIRASYTAASRPIRVAVTILRSDLNVISYELPARGTPS